MKGTKFILSPEFQPFSLNNTIFGIKRTRRIMKGNIVFVGIPFDLGTTYRSGARFAPFKIREMSRLISGVDFFLKKNIFENKSIVDYGDIKISNDVEQDIKNIEFEIKKIMKYGKFIALGGDHLITLPILRALNKKYGKINLLHLDAHLDSWDIVNSNKINHGTWLRRAMEENLLSNVFQLGIRGSIYSNKDIKFSEDNGINIITMRDFKNMGINKTVEKLNNEFLNEKFYITIDIDVVDPAFAPGTGVPEPGGMSSYEIMEFLRLINLDNLIGGDIVEVSPPYDIMEITSILASYLIFIMISKTI
ncbi:MAG: agmatinase [Thermoplasmata archaeon]